MKRQILLFVIIFCVLLLFTQPAFAEIYHYSLLELVENAKFIATGKVGKVGDTTAVVEVEEVLKGNISQKQITVTEIYFRGCERLVVDGRELKTKIFKEGEDVLLFLSSPKDGKYPVIAGGQGKVVLHDKMSPATGVPIHRGDRGSASSVSSAEYVESTKRLIEVSSIKDKEEKVVTLFKMCESPNPVLRNAATWFLGYRYVPREAELKKLRKHVLALMESKYAETRATGARMLWRYTDTETLALLVKATQDGELVVVMTACSSLYNRDPSEATKALVNLGKHDNIRVRIYACQELSRNNDPNAKKACADLLDNKDEKVRIQAARLLHTIRGEAWKEVVYPKLVEMLKGPSEKLQVAAATGLAASYNRPEVLKPLIDALASKKNSARIKGVMVQKIWSALIHIRNKHFADNPELTQYLYDHLHLVINHLEKSGSDAKSAVYILQRVGTSEALASLKKAAESHSDESVKQAAQAALKYRQESIAEAMGGCALARDAGMLAFMPLLVLLLVLVIRRKRSHTAAHQ